MPIEIEKKYRLTAADRRALEARLRKLGYRSKPVEFEENTIYGGGHLDVEGRALRLRRVNGRAILTFKQRLPNKSAMKHQLENESVVEDADAVDAILRSLQFQPALVYEKRRTRWQVGKAKVVMDELPFGLFMEIEAPVREIKRVEKLLEAEKLPAVMDTYPSLTRKLGKKRKGIVEARFVRGDRASHKRR